MKKIGLLLLFINFNYVYADDSVSQQIQMLKQSNTVTITKYTRNPTETNTNVKHTIASTNYENSQ